MHDLNIDERIQKKTKQLVEAKKFYNDLVNQIQKDFNEKIQLFSEKQFFFSLNDAESLYKALTQSPRNKKQIERCIKQLQNLYNESDEEDEELTFSNIAGTLASESDSEMQALSKSLIDKDDLLSSNSDDFDPNAKLDMDQFLNQFDNANNLNIPV